MNATRQNLPINRFSHHLPQTPQLLDYLRKHGEVEIGKWSIKSRGEMTNVAIYTCPVYYNKSKIGLLSAREGVWIMYEGCIPNLNKPQSIFNGKKRVLQFADPSRENINLVYMLNQKNNNDPRRDGWTMIPFP